MMPRAIGSPRRGRPDDQTYDYLAGDRLVEVQGSSQGTESYGYDAGGRVTSIQTGSQDLSLGYDAYDDLTSVKNQADGPQVQYVYDASGNLVGMKDASGETGYLVGPVGADGNELPYLSEDGSGDLLSGYVYAGDQPIMRFGPDGPIYYLPDGLGSVVALANAAGATVAQFAYDAFGNLRSGDRARRGPSGQSGRGLPIPGLLAAGSDGPLSSRCPRVRPPRGTIPHAPSGRPGPRPARTP